MLWRPPRQTVALFPVDNADRIVFSANVLGHNHASSSGSAVYLVTVSDQSLQMTSNVVDGNTEASLVQCDGGPFVVPASNRLRNARGPELGGACEPEAAR